MVAGRAVSALTIAWEESDRARSEIADAGRADRRVPRRAGPGGGRADPTVTYDRYSFMIDGHRVWLWSGRVPLLPAAQPRPLARPAREAQGERLQRRLAVLQLGLPLARAGRLRLHRRPRRRPAARHRRRGRALRDRPARARTSTPSSTRGGFPAWLTTQAGRARTQRRRLPGGLGAVVLARSTAIIARHQFTDGRGPVILYQIENEYDGATPTYMEELKAAARRDGITVPLFHNDKGRNLLWSAGPGAPEIYATDTYPAGFDCNRTSFPGSPTTASCATAPRSTRRGPASATARSSAPSSRAAPSTRGAAPAMTAAGALTGPTSSGCSTPTTSRTSSRRRTSTWPTAARTGAGRPTPTSSTPPTTTAPRSARRGD